MGLCSGHLSFLVNTGSLNIFVGSIGSSWVFSRLTQHIDPSRPAQLLPADAPGPRGALPLLGLRQLPEPGRTAQLSSSHSFGG